MSKEIEDNVRTVDMVAADAELADGMKLTVEDARAFRLELEKRRLELYRPYLKQQVFHKAGAQYRERLLRAGNQMGKTLAAAAEIAFHATGKYPSWWEGRKFATAPVIWAGGITGEVTRDTIQKLLIGDEATPGGGFIPTVDIVQTTPSRGVSGLTDTIFVRHTSGSITRLRLKYYEQGREKWQGDTVHVVWFDEEPPLDLYLEGLTRTNATRGMVFLTFTPLKGVSDVVRRFLHESSPDRSDTNMTIDDALHIPVEERNKIIESYPAHEREARIYGTPVQGSGLIFPVAESSIACRPFQIKDMPYYWMQIAGIDFGWDHPTAGVRLVYDGQADIVYVTDVYKRREATPLVHAAALKSWGTDLQWAWPHDGLQHDKGSGDQLSEIYRKQGLNMLPERTTFEDGSSGVEAGLAEMLMRMETGRLKVFAHLNEWFEEFRLYHRKDGKVVKEYDDILSATRYALMSLRFAQPLKPLSQFTTKNSGAGGSVRTDYNPLGISYIKKMLGERK